MKLTTKISERVAIPIGKVERVISLIEEGATIPFIARYRKEATGSLDEVQIGSIQNEYKRLQEFLKRKESILASIEEQGGLDERLKGQITDCWDEVALEDLYLPFKRKVKTKATVARDHGLEGLARIIMAQKSNQLLEQARRFCNEHVKTVEEALEGAGHIISEWISEHPKIRDIVRSEFNRKGKIYAKVEKGKEVEGENFKDYFAYEGLLSKTPSHRFLAILRGEAEKVLKVKIDVGFDDVYDRIKKFYIRQHSASIPYIEESIKDALKRLILPSIRNEFLKIYKDKADDEAIRVFVRNARALLLSAPLGAKRILGIDPGFRTGCKVVAIDTMGDLLHHCTIFPHAPQRRTEESEGTISKLMKDYQIEAVAIGNGTAGKETYQWLTGLFKGSAVEIYLVNEDGASIYSASEIGRDEFPDHDITVRGAVSIARRLMDPLAELVKIDPKSIGVGQYQHDVNQKKLKDSLTETVESCVNLVGVNLNTASKHLLAYISGLGPGLAENIVNYRSDNGPFELIDELKKVPRLGAKAFEQCAGFLRIRDGKNPLDNTGVHPESYPVIERMLKDLKLDLEEIVGNEKVLREIAIENYITETVGLITLKDIIEELKKPGLDPRSKAKTVTFEAGLNGIEDLKVGQIVSGVVTNITNFGAFIDIGIKDSALLHISQIVDHYISDPATVLTLNQEVKVKVTEVDINRKRISVSMKQV